MWFELYVWIHQNIENEEWLLAKVKEILYDQFVQSWLFHCNNCSKGTFYNLFTNNKFEFRKYLDLDIPTCNIFKLLRFRTTNHRLPIETGRWFNIPRNERLCNLCEESVGDEFHYVMNCKALENDRISLVPRFFSIGPNIYKFHSLFSSQDVNVLNNLCKFIDIINERVAPPG